MKICIIPHYGINGGSGKYTKQFSEILNKRYNVFFWGKYSKEFSTNLFNGINKYWKIFFNKNIIPNYEGVSKFRKYIYTFSSYIYRLVWMLKKSDYTPIIFILTSSIQAPLIPALKNKFINCKWTIGEHL